jgi:hypothetical protein
MLGKSLPYIFNIGPEMCNIQESSSKFGKAFNFTGEIHYKGLSTCVTPCDFTCDFPAIRCLRWRVPHPGNAFSCVGVPTQTPNRRKALVVRTHDSNEDSDYSC